MSNYEFIKSTICYPQQTFETFSVKMNGEDLFYWSDIDGFNCKHLKQEIRYAHYNVYLIYLAMEAAQIASEQGEIIASNKYENYNFYPGDVRTDEFGVKWTEI